jgi:uncharacterized protein
MDKLKRYEMIHQLIILCRVDPFNSDRYHNDIEILRNGYEFEYTWEKLADPMTKDQCKEVLDILDMYRAIDNYWRKNHTDPIPIPLKFGGFDGNNESRYLDYTRFVIYSGRYTELKYGNDNCGFNSHFCTLGKYRRMLAAWNGMGSSVRNDLTENNVNFIVNATEAEVSDNPSHR